MKTLLVLVATFSLFMVACSPVGSGGGFGTDSSFNLSAYSYVPDDIDFGINDIVSPEIITLPDGQMLLYTTGGGGISVYRSTDGLSFTKTSATTPQGSDPTVVATADGRYRMYYLDHLDNTIKTAISDDALNFTNEGSTGIQNSTGTQAWGVPDTIVLPDGRVRIYWVDQADGEMWEVIDSAVSVDGINFTRDAGHRTTGGFVDPYILKAEEGDYLAIFSISPGMAPQKLYIGRSTDGLTWNIEDSPVVTLPDGGSALDPTAIELADGSYRIYFSATRGSNPMGDFYLTSGVLSKI